MNKLPSSVSKLAAFMILMLALQLNRLKAQTTIKVRRDTVTVANGELKILNGTKAVRGFLYNDGTGSTSFNKLHLIRIGDTAIAIAGQDTLGVNFGTGGTVISTSVSPVNLSAVSLDNSNMKLRWWKSADDLFSSPKIGLIGDSQGQGGFTSAYQYSIAGRLISYIYATANNALVTNYCKNGYNSRKLAPSGSNTYVDMQNNVTKAIADGNKIIILINTSNDFYASGAGGEMTLSESMSNTALIADACEQAGVTLFVLSTFPRTSLPDSSRAKLAQMALNLKKTFGNRGIYVYNLLLDASGVNNLKTSYDVGDGVHLNDQGTIPVFNAIRDALNTYYTANTDVLKYRLVQAAAYNGQYQNFQVITAPTDNSLTLPKDTNYYKVRIEFNDGYFSNWSNVTKGTLNNPADNASPSIALNSPVTVTLPVDSCKISPVIYSPNAPITSYQWIKIFGGTALIHNPSDSAVRIAGLSQGTYIFRCTVTDNRNKVSAADVTVNVISSVTASASKFNFNNGAQNLVGWIDVSGGGLAAANNAKTWSDNTTGIGLLNISNSTAAWGNEFGTGSGNSNNSSGENVADTGGFVIDAAVIRTTWYSNVKYYMDTTSNQMKLTGLLPNKKYTLRFYSSIANSTHLNATPTVFVVNNNVINTKSVNSVGNTSKVVTFTGITPNSSGQIPFFVGIQQGISTYGMLNALIVELDTTNYSNFIPLVSAGTNQTIILPTNSVTLTGSVLNAYGDPQSLAWAQVSGPSTATIGSSTQLSTAVTNLQQGTYVFRCSVTNNYNKTGSSNVTVIVQPVNNTIFNVAFSKWNFTQSGWMVIYGAPHLAELKDSATYQGQKIYVKTGTWTPYGTSSLTSSDSTGERNNDGGGYIASQRIVAGNFYGLKGYDSLAPQVIISNLPSGTYKVTVFGSLRSSVANNLSVDCNTVYRVENGTPVTVNNKANTSKTAVFTNVTPSSGGTIRVYCNPTTGGSNSFLATLNFITIEKTN